jgi:hypothetical protein
MWLNDRACCVRQQKHCVLPLKETKVCGDLELRSKNFLDQFRVQKLSGSDKDVEFYTKEDLCLEIHSTLYMDNTNGLKVLRSGVLPKSLRHVHIDRALRGS